MEQKRKAIVGKLISNIEKAISEDLDVDMAVQDLSQFFAALNSEVNYDTSRFLLDEARRKSNK